MRRFFVDASDASNRTIEEEMSSPSSSLSLSSESIYLVLPSNASVAEFPDNQNSNYRTRLECDVDEPLLKVLPVCNNKR